ncbi:unnamed protein product [Mytilus edulis]|uniref:Ig-like domain-containing protein n=1 Tax=Mytilus edulis TaxID=6550 RepID=A0A8S3QP11_MYTED|nr:unnamed protein product [Mytilus edulis]
MGTRPEIVDAILPEVKQQGQIGYLNCSVINLNPSSAVLQWVKQTTPSGTPLLISSNEKIHVNDVVEGHPKYYVRKSVINNRELYQLVIRALTENDAGSYTFAPTVKLDSKSNIVVQEGSNITLKCEANGIPTPNITWKRGDGLPLPGGGFQHWVRRANPRAEVIWYKVNPATGSLDQIQDNDKYDLNQQDDQRLKADEKWYSLTIKTVQGSDFGKFYCHAESVW